MSLLKIRPAKPEDAGFIINGWASTFRQYSHVSRATDADGYWRFMRGIIKSWMSETDAKVLVACDPSDEDTLVGFAAASNAGELHYVYVRDGFRKEGYARDLIEPLNVSRYTIKTDAGMRRLKPAERGWSFAPRFTL